MRRAWLLLAAALLLAACGGISAGSPSPATGSGGSAAGDATPSRLAPPVTNPRDVRALADRPCELLTKQQLSALGFDQPGRQRAIPQAQECKWDDNAHTQEIAVSADPNFDLLGATYRTRRTYAVFQPTEVAGLPAAFQQANVGGASCVVSTGLADTQGLEVTYYDLRDPTEDPCGHAKRVAEAVISNLPPLS